jgi:probable F420-dependent oxidoreductase
MRIGIQAPFLLSYSTPGFYAEAGRAMEAAGFCTIWVPEHVVLFDEYESRYPYAEDGKLKAGPQTALLEPLHALTFLAAVTSTVRLGTSVLLLPQRNPVYTAKAAASVDWLSGGRLDLGVGIGWLEEEFQALDVPWERRGDRTRSYVGVLRSLWCDDVSSWSDEFYDLPECRQYPKPVQQPHPPIHFGGESDAALRRTADIGQGWFGFGLTPERAAERIGRLHELLAERGRAPEDVAVTVSAGPGVVDVATAQRFAEAGADQLVVSTAASSPERFLEQIARIGDELVAPCRDLTAGA